jgi:predicted ATPase/DNA-binding CsgD family transcriptional regulator
LITQGGRLPGETSRFFGRSQEAAAVKDALAGSRLVTLTGPGGVGKTHLAVKVAGELAAAFPDGVFLADLSAARDEAAVVRAAVAALGLPDGQFPAGGQLPSAAQRQPGSIGEEDQSGRGWLAGQLSGRRLLLILDTAEHVVDACAALVDAILRGGGGTVLMVTSRQPLELPGEVVFRIRPLPVGGDGGDALRLFADRAAAAFPGFAVTDDVLPKLVRLCYVLDGLPLAIELAALRLRAVGIDELLVRLPGRLRLLSSGRRGAAGDRTQSLEASAGWSYQFCSPAERLLWTRLSVFADGFDLAAAEAVCGFADTGPPAGPAPANGPPAGVLGPLVGLVDKSVVLRAPGAGDAARYQLLAIVREFGAAHAQDAAAGAERHRRYYLNVAREFAASWIGPGQPGLAARLGRDEANLRLALEGALAAGDAAAAVDLATACWPWLVSADRLAEADAWLARALGDADQRDQGLEHGRGLPTAPGPAPAPVPPPAGGIAFAAQLAAGVRTAQGDAAGASVLRARFQAAGTVPPPAARAAEPGQAAQAGQRYQLADHLNGLAGAFEALRRGEFAQCAARCVMLAAGLPAGERWVRGWASWVSGVAAWCAGGRAADARLRTGLQLLAPFGGEFAVAQHLEAFAWLAAARGDARRTARLQGAADQMWQRLAAHQGVRAPRFGLLLLDAERDLAERQARDVLGEAGYAGEHAAGATLSTAAAIRDVLPGVSVPFGGEPGEQSPPAGQAPAQAAGPAQPGTGPADGGTGSGQADRPGAADGPDGPSAEVTDQDRWELLTAREREVAALVAAGLTNKHIAARLVVSKRTVDAHLEHILGKLGYSSRVQVAALASAAAAREGRDGDRPEGGPRLRQVKSFRRQSLTNSGEPSPETALSDRFVDCC